MPHRNRKPASATERLGESRAGSGATDGGKTSAASHAAKAPDAMPKDHTSQRTAASEAAERFRAQLNRSLDDFALVYNDLMDKHGEQAADEFVQQLGQPTCVYLNTLLGERLSRQDQSRLRWFQRSDATNRCPWDRSALALYAHFGPQFCRKSFLDALRKFARLVPRWEDAKAKLDEAVRAAAVQKADQGSRTGRVTLDGAVHRFQLNLAISMLSSAREAATADMASHLVDGREEDALQHGEESVAAGPLLEMASSTEADRRPPSPGDGVQSAEELVEQSEGQARGFAVEDFAASPVSEIVPSPEKVRRHDEEAGVQVDDTQVDDTPEPRFRSQTRTPTSTKQQCSLSSPGTPCPTHRKRLSPLSGTPIVTPAKRCLSLPPDSAERPKHRRRTTAIFSENEEGLTELLDSLSNRERADSAPKLMSATLTCDSVAVGVNFHMMGSNAKHPLSEAVLSRNGHRDSQHLAVAPGAPNDFEEGSQRVQGDAAADGDKAVEKPVASLPPCTQPRASTTSTGLDDATTGWNSASELSVAPLSSRPPWEPTCSSGTAGGAGTSTTSCTAPPPVHGRMILDNQPLSSDIVMPILHSFNPRPDTLYVASSFHFTDAQHSSRLPRFLPDQHRNLVAGVYLSAIRHWCAVFINLDDQSIETFDPLGNPACVFQVQSIARAVMSLNTPEVQSWRLINSRGPATFRQSDSISCGLFSVVYLLHRMFGLDLPDRLHPAVWRILLSRLFDGDGSHVTELAAKAFPPDLMQSNDIGRKPCDVQSMFERFTNEFEEINFMSNQTQSARLLTRAAISAADAIAKKAAKYADYVSKQEAWCITVTGDKNPFPADIINAEHENLAKFRRIKKVLCVKVAELSTDNCTALTQVSQGAINLQEWIDTRRLQVQRRIEDYSRRIKEEQTRLEEYHQEQEAKLAQAAEDLQQARAHSEQIQALLRVGGQPTYRQNITGRGS
ncbi:hypothetical protein PSPO01_13933 [Paraphaeosphaeria sporulosa]